MKNLKTSILMCSTNYIIQYIYFFKAQRNLCTEGTVLTESFKFKEFDALIQYIPVRVQGLEPEVEKVEL